MIIAFSNPLGIFDDLYTKLINKPGTISQTEIWQKAVSLDQLMSENENHTVMTHLLKEHLVRVS